MNDDEIMQLQPQEMAKPAKLTDWKKEPSLKDLKNDRSGAKSTHDLMMTKIKEWNDLMKVAGSAKPKTLPNRSKVQPKLIRKQAEWRYSALTEPFLSSEKIFSVEPRTFEDVESAQQNELLLNWQFSTKINKLKFIDDLVRSTVDEGTSVVRVGWVRSTVTVKEEAPVFTFMEITEEQQLIQLQDAINLKVSNPRQYEEVVPEELKQAVTFYEETGSATVAVQSGTTQIDVEKVLENRPTVEVLDPNNVIIDPTCQGDMSKAMFAVFSFETCKAELLKTGIYKNLDSVNWADTGAMNDPDHSTNSPNDFQLTGSTRRKVVAHEYWGYWDINDDGSLVPIVATWIGDVMIRLEENPYPDGKLPFILVPYLPVKRELYGEADAELLADNQKILGAVTRGMIDLLGRSANAQQGFAKGMLDPLNRKRLADGQDYEFNPSISPQMGMIEHKYPEIPQSALVMASLQNQEAESLTGVKAFSGGISGDTYGDVAAGIRGVLDAASKREMAILRRLAKGVCEIGQKIMAMNAVFLSETEVVRVTNSKFVTVNREELAGNYDLIVDISTAEVDNQKANDLSFMLQTMGNTMDFGITKMILAEIAKLKRMPALANMIKAFEPQPNPLDEQLKQLEIEEKRKSIEKLDSEIARNMAEARKALSDADLKDLSYVEQETGTTHERNLQQQKAQAQANQGLEITKALVKPVKMGDTPPNIEAAIGFNAISQ